MMCTKKEALAILSEVYQQCSPLIPITDAFLYGSYARGDFSSASDVDIMLVSPLSPDQLHSHRWEFAHISSEVSMDHDVTVSLTVRSKEQFNPKNNPFHNNVVKDGIRYSTVM